MRQPTFGQLSKIDAILSHQFAFGQNAKDVTLSRTLLLDIKVKVLPKTHHTQIMGSY